MKRKVNIEEKSRILNEFRMDNVNKTFTGQELSKKLIELGFNKMVASAIAQKCFPYEQMGKGRLYEVPKDPIHKSAITAVYDRMNSYGKKPVTTQKPQISQQEAWDTLVAAGVIKTRFNLNTLKTKYPKVYLDCLEYELNPEK